MARKRQGIIEDIVDIAASLPWWGGFLISILSYFFFHYIATIPNDVRPQNLQNLGQFASKQIFITLSSFAQYIVPFAAIIGSIVSIIRSSKNIQPRQNTHTASVSKPKVNFSNTSNSVSEVECPICQSSMIKRTSRKGANSGQAFWGCSQYPSCKGTRPI